MFTPMLTAGEYRFEGGFPTVETVQRAYDDADLVRAITPYRFFSSVSALCIYKGNVASGMVANRVFGLVETALPPADRQRSPALAAITGRPRPLPCP
jgi:hypothetical protein